MGDAETRPDEPAAEPAPEAEPRAAHSCGQRGEPQLLDVLTMTDSPCLDVQWFHDSLPTEYLDIELLASETIHTS